MSESQARPRRRGFMLGAAASAATAAVVTLQPQPPGPSTETAIEPPKPERGGGYRLTEHVRQYYRTTLI